MKVKFDAVSIWLIAIILMIMFMVCLGGITRLTGSGLSITEWKPIMGAIPPIGEEEWAVAFQKYQTIPQFQILNSKMTVEEFKFIFFWEYLHRLVGRLIGLVIIFPGFYFGLRKRFDKVMMKKITLGFILGGLQGLLGWFMVKSGLSELVYVSHLRLSAHLILALFILGYWTAIYLHWNGIIRKDKISKPVIGVAFTLVIQLFYGALVAGLKAGMVYNTFPKMNDEWVPDQVFFINPLWLNFFNNSASVQFIHRWLAVILVCVSFWALKKDKKPAGRFFIGLLALQFMLGVLTLIYQVPLILAALHQLNACFMVVSLTVWALAVHGEKYNAKLESVK